MPPKKKAGPTRAAQSTAKSRTKPQKPRPFSHRISDAMRTQLGELVPKERSSYAQALGSIAVRAAHKRLKSDLRRGEFTADSRLALEFIMERVEGKVPQPIMLDKLIIAARERTQEDKDFYIEHGRWPDEVLPA